MPVYRANDYVIELNQAAGDANNFSEAVVMSSVNTQPRIKFCSCQE
jgi:hypothetical protein